MALFLKAWDASKIFIKSSRALQGWEAITDLQEREGEQGCFATSSKKGMGKGVRSEPRREIGKHRCTHFRVPPTFPLESRATRVNICLWTLVTWLVTSSGVWGLANNTWHLIPKPFSSSKSFFLLYYTCSREYTTSYKEENFTILPITLWPQKNFYYFNICLSCHIQVHVRVVTHTHTHTLILTKIRYYHMYCFANWLVCFILFFLTPVDRWMSCLLPPM